MNNFDKLIFSPDWVKICKESMDGFADSKVVLLHFGKKGVNILGFGDYSCDAPDLLAVRTKDIAHYFMLLSDFNELYRSVFSTKTFTDACNEIGSLDKKHGFIANGIGLREVPFLSIKAFELKDARDLAALGKLEGMLWR